MKVSKQYKLLIRLSVIGHSGLYILVYAETRAFVIPKLREILEISTFFKLSLEKKLIQ